MPYTPGKWLLHCHVDDHLKNGMFAWYTVLGDPSDNSNLPLRGQLPLAAQGNSARFFLHFFLYSSGEEGLSFASAMANSKSLTTASESF